MISGTFTIAKKEFIHIIRDPRSLILIMVLPLLMMVLYGYAINMDVKNVKLGVLDNDHSWASREVIRGFGGTDFFEIFGYYDSRNAIRQAVESGAIKGVLVFPAGFTESVGRGVSPEMQVIIDGSDANTGKIIQTGVSVILSNVILGSTSAKPFFTMETRVWYNPELEGVNFIVPGLVAVFLMMIATILTSITIAREKETGTMIQLRLSPASASQIIIGKVLPYTVLAFIVGTLMLTFALLYYGVPFHGSPLLLAGLSVAYLLASLSIGLLVSTVAESQQIAMAGGMLGTMLPSILLSGFIFPLRSMPVALQWISTVIPAKYFLEILRGIMLKGNSMIYLWPPLWSLLIFTAIVMVISIARFRRQFKIAG
ncbi:MAG: ABC transporter permease [Candidatus Marinimicrobia bacterium]|nr:ABC transporter permease [Candidatus Neomarinimicrobiota bacterium]MCF7829471.1 ABC transporter permease [Candidatus Neomarinimicrobiota bacterium]MCF7882350.1 ABC transporter permease [Candidatus Neomarinimicrobiota bacterium]